MLVSTWHGADLFLRALYLAWINENLADLEADFRTFYRIDDFNEIDGPRFFRLAMRVGAYQGVVAARWAKKEQEEGGEPRSNGQQPQQKQRQLSPQEMQIAAPGWVTYRKAKAVED